MHRRKKTAPVKIISSISDQINPLAKLAKMQSAGALGRVRNGPPSVNHQMATPGAVKSLSKRCRHVLIKEAESTATIA